MKFLMTLFICFTVVFFSCTDRDDNLEGVQIRVRNSTNTTFTEVSIDSLIFSDVPAEETVFYQQYEGDVLPNTLILTTDSLSMTIEIDSIFQIDSTALNLFTYRIRGLSDNMDATVEVLRD